ncbi:uncharacterized protein LOC143020278 [Oratosquilla oratoria]|uniref:uncharacterized protein LOC143020278 n=1 Tax=Oratosquilla oratoria TaxID=337810 RepID=UPI003F75B214
MKKVILPQVAVAPVNGNPQLFAVPAGKGQPLLLNLAPGAAPTLLTSTVISPSLVQVSPGPVSSSSIVPGTQRPVLLRMPTPSTIAPTTQSQTMKLVQTTSGKKLLLTNVVESTKTLQAPVLVRHDVPVQKQQIQQVQQVTVLQKPVLSNVQPVVAANAPKTIVLQNQPITGSFELGSKPALMKVQGVNQLLLVKKAAPAVSHPPLVSAIKTELPEPKIPVTFVQSSSSLATTITTSSSSSSTIPAPITKTLFMLGSSNQLPFKVVGNPIPVRLKGNGRAAPKVPYKLVSTSSMQKLILAPTSATVPVITTAPSVPLRSCESVPKVEGTTVSSKVAIPVSQSAPVDSTSPSKKRAYSASPPAYLNIRIKVEPSTEDADVDTKDKMDEVKKSTSEADKENGPVMLDSIKIKEEPKDEEEEEDQDLMMHPMSHLDISIKEEPHDREDELLVKDQQLRELLKVTQPERTKKKKVSVHPKFYLRTADEKLLPIDKESLQALGLHKDQDNTDAKRVASSLLQLQKALTLPSNQHHSSSESEGSIKCPPLLKNVAPGDKCQSPQPPAVSTSVKKAENSAFSLPFGSYPSKLPKTANVIDFVNRNVPEKPTFDVLDNFSDLSSLQNLVSDSETLPAETRSHAFGRKHSSHIQKKLSTTILGKHTVNGKTMIRISIESGEGEDDVCDIELTSMNKFKCPFCGKEFKTKDHVISHIRVHTGERPYPCDVCGKRYRQRIDIIRHMRIHTGEKPFTCENCGASFNQKSNLRSHMRVHTGERPVQCKVCGKGFSRNTHLKQHMKLHTGEKPYKCSTCNRPFRFKSGLQAHERIHTGMKPYACSLCGRSFTQVVGLIRHEKTHTGEKPFRCQMCGKSFNNRENLQKHVRKHTGDRPFKCDLCSKTFTDNGALRCHRKKYHSNMLICVICLREDFKSRIELREHLRAHERENWHETPEGDLVPIIRGEDHQMLCVDDTQDSIGSFDEEEEYMEDNDGEENNTEDGKNEDEDQGNEEEENEDTFEEIQVEVELEPDDPMDDDVENSDFEEENQLTTNKCDGDSECGQNELQIEIDPDNDPLG